MAYATLEKMPGDGTWAALEAAAVRLAPDTVAGNGEADLRVRSTGEDARRRDVGDAEDRSLAGGAGHGLVVSDESDVGV